MSYRGEVRGGVVVLEGVALPEGTVVRVEPVRKKPKHKRKRALDLIFTMGDLAVETGIKDLAMNCERDEWHEFGAQQFARVYGPNEPEYSLADVKPELSK